MKSCLVLRASLFASVISNSVNVFMGRPNPGNDVFALRVREDIRRRFPSRRYRGSRVKATPVARVVATDCRRPSPSPVQRRPRRLESDLTARDRSIALLGVPRIEDRLVDRAPSRQLFVHDSCGTAAAPCSRTIAALKSSTSPATLRPRFPDRRARRAILELLDHVLEMHLYRRPSTTSPNIRMKRR